MLTGVLRLMGRALYHLHLHPLVIWFGRGTPRVVVYHACEPAETDWTRGLGSNTPPEALAAHLDFFVRHYRVVPMSALRTGTGAPPRGALAITFDDGYRSVHEHAAPQLRERDLPATVYLVTGAMEAGALVWVNELAWWLYRHPEPTRERVCGTLHLAPDAAVADIVNTAWLTCDADRIAALLDAVRAAVPDAEPTEGRRHYLSWEEVAELRRSGIEFGGHTVTHHNLTRMPATECARELSGCREHIRERTGRCDTFAYPFGAASPDTRRAATAAGYEALLELGGSNRPWNPMAVARVILSDQSTAGLFAEIEVVEPVKGVLRRLLRR